MNSISKERLDYLDVMKGIGIILVVLAHTTVHMGVIQIIYSFHMPLFFCVSGFLSKHKNISFKDFALKKINALLVPFLSFSFLSMLMTIVSATLNGRDYDFEYYITRLFFLNGEVFHVNAPIWFLMVLFVIESMYYFVIDKSVKFKFFFALLMSIIGYFNEMLLPFGIHTAIIGLVFYTVGDMFKGYEKQFEKITTKTYVYIILTMILTTLLALLNMHEDFVNIYRLNLGNYFLFYLTAVVGAFCCYLISRVIYKNRILEYLGKNSIVLLCTHFVFMQVLTTIYYSYFRTGNIFIDNNIGLIITPIILLVTIPAIYLLNNYFYLFIGKKKRLNNVVINSGK